jgi:branched-chain amino acid transport system ATP-binding protein
MTGAIASSILEIAGLSVRYDGNLALKISSLALGQSEMLGVVGANGAGKSTLANAVLGWSRGLPRVAGTIRLGGTDISSLSTHDRVRAGLILVPEGKSVFSQMSVDENLTSLSPPKLKEQRHAYSVQEVYELFPRLHERRGHLGSQLSGGERQMLAIGRALRLGPMVLILDEPSIGLAPRLVSAVLQTLKLLAQRGLSVLLIEQNVRAAIEVVDRLMLLERGRVIAEGPAPELRDDPRIAEAYLGAQAH